MDPFEIVAAQSENEKLAAWAARRIQNFSGWGSEPRSIGYAMHGTIRGAVIYTNFSGPNVFASVAMDGPFTRRFLHAIFWNPFVSWNVRHMSAAIEASNWRSYRICKHLGFKVEGRMRESAADGGDVILMGMLKRECRYL